MSNPRQLPQPTRVIQRSGAGLRDAMFDVLERVRDGRMDKAEAMAMANVARVIIESAELQMEFDANVKDDTLPPTMGDMPMVPALPHSENGDDGGK